MKRRSRWATTGRRWSQIIDIKWTKACSTPKLPWRSSYDWWHGTGYHSVPIMVDSSKWDILETGLKNVQGSPR